MKILTAATALLLAFANASPTPAKNQMPGVFSMSKASRFVNGTLTNDQVYGPTPYGMLVVTSSMRAIAQVNNPNNPRYPEPHLLGQPGTPELYEKLVAGTFGISSIYEVDEEGLWLSQKVLGCSYPNWIGLERGREGLRFELREDGSGMREYLNVGGGFLTVVEWERVADV